MGMVSEAELVRRCLGGESAAFETLVERHREGAVGFCYHQIGDFHAAQDLAQEAFLRAYSDLDALREPPKRSSAPPRPQRGTRRGPAWTGACQPLHGIPSRGNRRHEGSAASLACWWVTISR